MPEAFWIFLSGFIIICAVILVNDELMKDD